MTVAFIREPAGGAWRYSTPAGYYLATPNEGGWVIHHGREGQGPALGWHRTLIQADKAIETDVHERMWH